MADRRPPIGRTDPARRGPDGDDVLRRDAVHGRAPPLPRRRRCARPAGRGRASPSAGPRRTPRRAGPDRAGRGSDRDTSAAGPAIHPVRELGRRRPRWQPLGHGRDHGPRPADPRRSRHPRLRGGRDPAHADGRRRGSGGRRGRAARPPARGRRRRDPGDDASTPPSVPRRAVPATVRRDRRAPAADARGADRGGWRAGRRPLPRTGRARWPSSTSWRPPWSRIDSGGSPGARSRTSAGRSRRSASTWRRSRSASTARSTRQRSRPSAAATSRASCPLRLESAPARSWRPSGRSPTSRPGSARPRPGAM